MAMFFPSMIALLPQPSPESLNAQCHVAAGAAGNKNSDPWELFAWLRLLPSRTRRQNYASHECNNDFFYSWVLATHIA